MSRKLRVPKAQIGALPSPAWTYALLTGESAPCRIAGWVTCAQAGMWGEPTADEVWERHREALIALAAQHGFEAYWETSRPPAGPGLRAWCEEFLRAHRY